jgi:hypothetical protein
VSSVWGDSSPQDMRIAFLRPMGLMAAVAHPLEGPYQAMLTRHHTEGTMAIHPTVALAVTPGRIRV